MHIFNMKYMLYYILRIIILYQSTLFYVAAEMCVWQPSIRISPLSVGLTVALALPHELIQTTHPTILGILVLVPSEPFYNTSGCHCMQVQCKPNFWM